ncbi:universal stress protein [Secundilactobacillus kimchicus]|uniref:UspA domain-containing protein n=1 Tax=Secundilactobacillus kimchicus JCM 15530 TaxID=1302272 RepID=A0A0R1HN63_9LACO|nr:universal stress protein [Secundilactobacillus kimchicus]KRK47871.1 hypothetical protein FC96_GL002076 [Secundilactobacillus kimchicus JCM 15530]
MSTTEFHRILVGVDDSADALLAFDYAIAFAKENQAELVITSILERDDMNVYQTMDKDFFHGEYAELEQHVLKYQQQAEQAGVAHVRAIVAEGEPGETIIEKVIPQVKPDVLIVGSLAKKGVRKYFGSQAAYMAKYAPIPVFVIR